MVVSTPTTETQMEREGGTSDRENVMMDGVKKDEKKTELENLTRQREKALLEAKESHEQTQALMQALDLLTKLASMNHSMYSSTLSGTGGSIDSHHLPPVDPDTDVSSLQSRLDSLQSEWKLEETPVPKLLQSIHRLQSNTSQLVKEVDQQTLQLHSMEAYCSKREKHEEKLEKAIHKLHQQNRKLREKLKSKKHERNSIVKNVKEYVNHVNLMKMKKEELTIEEQRVANQLKAHERLLRLENLERAALDDGGGNRSRISTYDSIFDEDGGNRSLLSTNDSIDSISDPDMDDASSVASSVSSVSTGGSLVTDEGVATVRYTSSPSPMQSPVRSTVVATREPTSPDEETWLSMRAAFGCAKPPEKPAVFKLTFPTGTKKIGVQLLKVPLEKEKEKEKAPRIGLLTEALLLGVDTQDKSPSKKSVAEQKPDVQPGSTNPKDVDGSAPPPRSLSINFKFDSMLRRRSKNEEGVQKGLAKETKDDDTRHKVYWLNSKDDESTPSKHEEHDDYAFLVCGFDGFDSKRNVRPALGARLVAVGRLSLEDGHCTLAQVREAMHAPAAHAKSGDSQSTFTMSFRNEPLNKKQKEILNRAVTAAELKQQEKHQNTAASKTEDDNPVPSLTNENTVDNTVKDADEPKKEDSQMANDNGEIGETASRQDSPVESESDGNENSTVDDDNAAKEKPGEKFRKSWKDMGDKFKTLF